MADFIESRRQDLMVLILGKMGAGLRKKVEADDVYQEVCKTALESFQKVEFDERGPFGWLVGLIDRKVVDLKRKFETQKRDSSKEVGIHGSDSDRIGFVNLLVASITSPSKAFSRKQKEFQILEAMGNLTEEQQTVLNLRYAKGLSCKLIAEKIGKSDGATRVLISRSLTRLRDAVGDG
jgi:RNA polymerase sigma-70 factor (ECF subfamily)